MMLLQFERFAEVEIRDFESNTRTVIGNEFEISFNYFKTIDQTQEDDSGTITIYGLNPDRINLLQAEGGEVRLRCGYVGANNIQTLIIAAIGRLSYEIKDNTTVTTIECSANLLNHYITEGFSTSGGNLPIGELILNLFKSAGIHKTTVDLGNAKESDYAIIKEYMLTAKTNFAVVGSLTETIKNLAGQIGFYWYRDKEDPNTMNIILTDVGISKMLSNINNGYAKIDKTDVSNTGVTFVSTLEANEKSKDITYLSYKTGLISTNKEYKVAHAFLDQEVVSDTKETPSGLDYTDTNPERVVSGDDNPYVSNNILKQLKLKSNEAIQNGRVRKFTAEFATLVANTFEYKTIRHFSAFNDHYHRNSPYNHPKGLAFDFSLNNGSLSNGAKVAQQVRDLAKTNGYKVYVKDEYNFPSPNSTGGHIHVKVHLNQSGAKEASTQPFNPQALPVNDVKRLSVPINKYYYRSKALLNPRVKPQSLIALPDKNGELKYFEGEPSYPLFYSRAREVTYVGNNKQGDWIMEIYSEDTLANLLEERAAKSVLDNYEEGKEVYSGDYDYSGYEWFKPNKEE